MKKSIATVGMLVLAVACAKSEQRSAMKSTASAAVPAAASAVANTNQLAGKVVETFNGGGYTYLRIATPAGDEWAAVPEVQIEKGANVAVDVQLKMEKFESTTLNRTFDRIIFGSIAGARATQTQTPDAGVITIEKPAGARTVAELWSARTSLNGQEVVVRGKVVKFNGGIMGTNWLHLQDGTGSPETGDNDLTVTSEELVSVGDVVTIKGTLAVDKDFGAGYEYPVIVEKAAIAK